MKINQNVKIVGTDVVLVPYRTLHVLKYHEWMSSTELQQLTASEPLTLEREYEMQQSWLADDDKLTFIVLDAETYHRTGDEIDAMIGDVNLFLTDPHDRTLAEVEVMIAEPGHRGKGLGRQAAKLIMKYGVERLSVRRYEAKIGLDNAASLRLFERLGFVEVSRSDAFGEATLALDAAGVTWNEPHHTQAH